MINVKSMSDADLFKLIRDACGPGEDPRESVVPDAERLVARILASEPERSSEEASRVLRTRFRGRHLAALAGSTGVAAGAAVAAVLFFAVGSNPGVAFAGWRATPTTPAPGQLAEAERTCGRDFGNPAVTDSRGPYTAEVYVHSATREVCISGDGISVSSAFTFGSPQTLMPGQIQTSGGTEQESAGNALTYIDGPTGAGVSAVSFELSDGTSVQATVSGGWYLAWWPGTTSTKELTITTASGARTMAVTLPPERGFHLRPCKPGDNCGSSWGGSNVGVPASSEGAVTAPGANSPAGAAPTAPPEWPGEADGRGR